MLSLLLPEGQHHERVSPHKLYIMVVSDMPFRVFPWHMGSAQPSHKHRMIARPPSKLLYCECSHAVVVDLVFLLPSGGFNDVPIAMPL